MRTGTTRTGARLVALLAILGLVAVALAGCGYAGDTLSDGAVAPMPEEFDQGIMGDEAAVMASEDVAERSVGTGADTINAPEADRLIIRDKSLRMEVEDVRDTVDEIRSIAGDSDAIITNLNVSTDDGPIYRYDEYGTTLGSGAALSGWITVRVPAATYDDFVDEVSGLGEILWEGESTDDVTQQHVDLSARLGNLEAEEARLREFFDAANNVEEMLLVENELVRVRGEIESLTAQIAYLERQAAMATVTIELSEPQPIVQPDGPDWGFASAITAGLQLAANVVKALIVVVLGVLPLAALALLAFFIIRAIVRSRRKRSENPDS